MDNPDVTVKNSFPRVHNTEQGLPVNHLRLKPKAWVQGFKESRVQVAGSHLPAPGTWNNILLADSQHLVAVSLESLTPLTAHC